MKKNYEVFEALARLPTLTYLTLDGWDLPEKGMTLLATSLSLTDIYIRSFYKWTEESVSKIEKSRITCHVIEDE
jgi:hypothetical protein